MRDTHIRAIEHKIHRIRTYKRIGKMLIVTVILVAGISLIGNIDDAMTEKEIQKAVLSEENEINDTNIDQAEKVAEIEQEEPVMARVGEFTITHYCPCAICCNKTDGITATGTQATVNRTIAVDPKVIPLGTQLIIDGQTYIAEDVGAGIRENRIDIFVDSHQEAIQRGKIKKEVFYDYGGEGVGANY